MRATIASKLKRRLTRSAQAERCGLVLSDGRIVETPNLAEDPTQGFRIPAEAMRDHKSLAVATWHTHPFEPANLSQKDYDGFTAWPKLKHYIVGRAASGRAELRCFAVDAGVVIEVAP